MGDRTFVDVLSRQASVAPDQRVFTFLIDGESDAVSMSLRELDTRARAIAAFLQSRVGQGERALLVYPPGLDYIAALFGCLYAGVVAVPAYPPRPNRSLARFQALIADAEPTVVLGSQGPVVGDWPTTLAWLSVEGLNAEYANHWQPPRIDGDSLALLQYTSGSTGSPKGVALTHTNLLANSALLHWRYDHSPATRGVMWAPPYHDMGLVGGILQPVYAGLQVTLMSPLAFLQRPVRWLQAISRTRAETSGGPNFAYDLCVDRTTPEQRAQLDLSSWKVAVNGAEPIRPQSLQRFIAAFSESGFRPEAFQCGFGLAEATLVATGGPLGAPPVTRAFRAADLAAHRVVPAAEGEPGAKLLGGCGQSLPGQRIVIIDPETHRPCPPDRVGEIWLSGPSVAAGYWNRPEETRQRLQARLVPSGEGPFLRTGDLGFFYDGELFVSGRLKDLLILAGRNIAPQDVEYAAGTSHPALAPDRCAAVSIERAGVEQLVVLAEVGRGLGVGDPEDMRRAVRRAVVEAMDVAVEDVVLLRPGGLPRTTSGKLQRHACRSGLLDGTLERWRGQ